MKSRQNWDAIQTCGFQKALLRWYGRHRRALPWRKDPTPYRVWISEVMLQQTQAKTVVSYFDRFLDKFPDIESLAQASTQKVLALWSGLGYYSRARNLHEAARRIAKASGSFPEEFDAIRSLPGIGRYTAGAICSIAFNQPLPVVDGNIRRVITRLSGTKRRLPEGFFWDLMSSWIPENRASSFNQAMMELGALICVPFQPRCPRCPVAGFCKARELGIQSMIPGARKKPTPNRRRIVTLVLEQKGRILLASSIKPDFIPGEWGLPSRLVSSRESPEGAASSLCGSILGHTIPLLLCARIRHSITSYQMTVWGFCGKAVLPVQRLKKTAGFRWVSRSSGTALLISSLFRKVLQKYGNLAR